MPRRTAFAAFALSTALLAAAPAGAAQIRIGFDFSGSSLSILGGIIEVPPDGSISAGSGAVDVEAPDLTNVQPGAAALVDFELGAVDIRTEGLLMAPAYVIPRLLARNGLKYEDIALWEIHEAFAAQLLYHLKALESPSFLSNKAKVDAPLGSVPRERINPNGGSVALGHPFGATGARILSQAIKELAALPSGSRAIVSICADGGVGSVALLQV